MGSWLANARAVLPRGRQLPEDVWRRRHVGVVVLLWLHAVAIPAYASVRGFSVAHVVLEGSVIPATALLAMWSALSRRARTVIGSLGLLSSSAVLVHLSGGLIEMHFHFFVMVAVVALYQDWLPFLAAVGYVFIHHGVMGAVDADSVYNHAAARENPWLWAGVHASFITGISVACLVTWRLNEVMLLHRERAEERLREESRITESLHEVGKVLSADLDTQRVVQAVTDAATNLTAAGFGAFFYNAIADNGEAYVLYTLSGAPMEAFAGFGLPRNTPIFAPTFAGEGVVRIHDVTEDSRYGRLPPHHGMPPGHLPVRSYLAVPVRSRNGDVLGGLFFGHPEPGRFGEAEERIVVGIASQAAIALDNARLYESEREARSSAEAAGARLGVLAEASRLLASSLEIDHILADLAELVASAVGDFCAVDLLEDDQSLRRLAWGGADNLAPAPVGPEGADHPVRKVLATRAPDVVNDAEGTPAVVVVPMVGHDAVLGALTVGVAPGSQRRLRHADVPFVEEVGRRAAMAIDNARLYARQRSVAATLQHSLLPETLPDIPGIDTAARYMAGGPGVEVGGDWYDVLHLPNGHLLLAIGDVVGRGERAAALMGQLRNVVRAYAIDGKRPAEVAEAVNVLMLESGQDQMATLLVADLDAETGVLTYAGAGHPPPLLVRADGSCVLLDGAGGLPVGAFSGARYGEVEDVVHAGDTVVLYTDGLVEERTEPLDVGIARLVSASTANRSDDLDSLCADIVATALAGRDVQDDAAVLAVRLLPLGNRLSFRLPAEPSVLGPLRSTLRRWLTTIGVPEADQYELLVACGEACSNAIRHGAGPLAPEFEIEAEFDGDVRIVVRDHGRWREPRIGVGGRGLSIIEHYVDKLDVDTGPAGTEVRISRRVHAPTAASQTVRA